MNAHALQFSSCNKFAPDASPQLRDKRTAATHSGQGRVLNQLPQGQRSVLRHCSVSCGQL
jgi:hypothetical protein